MEVHVGQAIPFSAVFQLAGVGVEGLTVTATVWNSLGVEVVTGAAATAIGGGLYAYTLASGANSVEGLYVCRFRTTSDGVDQKERPDRALSSYDPLSQPDGVEPGFTLRDCQRLALAVLGGKTTGMQPGSQTAIFRDPNDTVDRLTVTKDDFGNRANVVLDLD